MRYLNKLFNCKEFEVFLIKHIRDDGENIVQSILFARIDSTQLFRSKLFQTSGDSMFSLTGKVTSDAQLMRK